MQDVAAACQARDAALTAAEFQQRSAEVDKPFAPHELGQIAPPLLHPPVPAQQRPVADVVVHPVGPTPPGWMRNAAEIGIAQRGAIGMGGLPALDVLRVALVDLACAAWDTGCDLSSVAGLQDVQAATPGQLWEISEAMLMRIRAHLNELKKRNR